MGCKFSLLKNATLDNTPLWSLKDQIHYVKVLKVYDGDTIWIAIRINFTIYKLKVRMYGIDTPEMKPLKTQKNRDKEIAAAKKAKKFLADLVDQKVIKMKCGEWDKYGRLLGTLIIKGNGLCSSEINVNELMIKEGHAKAYFGGTKI
jgi:endonuclease YncB( thermonuclease family)